MKLLEHFISINGEGMYQGYRTLFLRFTGCNLRCSYCDTKYSYEGGEDKTVEEIVHLVDTLGVHRVTITGGEPLLQGIEMTQLCNHLTRFGYNVEIETNGSIPIDTLPLNDKLTVTMDYKCYYSGMEGRMDHRNFKLLRPTDTVKFVVASKDEINTAWYYAQKYKLKCNLILSPVFGQIDPKDIVDMMEIKRMDNFKMQLQIHKLIWPPEQRGV